MPAGSIILVAGMLSVGAWVGQQIEDGVVHRTAATTALYVDSMIAPDLQELATGATLTPEHQGELRPLAEGDRLRPAHRRFQSLDQRGAHRLQPGCRADRPDLPGRRRAGPFLPGEVAADISDLSADENAGERIQHGRLLEMYSPVRRGGTDEVIVAAEFYYTVDELEGEINAAQWRSWLVVGAATLVMYVLLYGFIRQASNTISHQQTALEAQVQRLTTLLAQNEALHGRVQRAAARTTALNERFLRRVSAELHDGPAQDLGLALLRLDHVQGQWAAPVLTPSNGATGPADDLDVIGSSLRRAMQEVRAISSGLGLPAMETWTLADVVSRVVRTHERRTGTQVQVELDRERASIGAGEDHPLPAGAGSTGQRLPPCRGQGQRVVVGCDGHDLHVAVMDTGRVLMGRTRWTRRSTWV